MVKNHNLASSILDASFASICRIIEWKCEIKGKYYYKVPTNYPSSKTCNRCGHISDITKDLSVREWICPSCGNKNDRDINASLNIMEMVLNYHYGLADKIYMCSC